MKSTLDRTLQRAKGYWQVDGLVEIGFSLLLAFLGLYFFLEAVLVRDTLFFHLFEASFFLLFIAVALLIARGTQWAKQQITYPRTGYVEYPRKKGSARLAAGIAGGLIAIVVTVFLSIMPRSLDWLPLLAGIIFAVVLVSIALKGTAVRFTVLAFISLAAGIVVSLAGFGSYRGTAFYYWIMAVALAGLWRIDPDRLPALQPAGS